MKSNRMICRWKTFQSNTNAGFHWFHWSWLNISIWWLAGTRFLNHHRAAAPEIGEFSWFFSFHSCYRLDFMHIYRPAAHRIQSSPPYANHRHSVHLQWTQSHWLDIVYTGTVRHRVLYNNKKKKKKEKRKKSQLIQKNWNW